MMPLIDLFHQLLYKSPEGFVAIIDYSDEPTVVRVYTPYGEQFGSTSDNPWKIATVRSIISWRIKWEKGLIRL